MSRRELLRLLALLGLSLGSPGLAEGKGSDRGKDKGKDKDKDDKSPGRPNNRDNRRNYYARVTLNDGAQVYCGGTRVVGDSPWLKLVAPGMWLEAEGSWKDKDFVAAQVKIVSPKVWAYYQGPAAPLGLGQAQRLEVWLQEGESRVLFQRSLNAPPNPVRVVAHYDGNRFLALPPNLIAPQNLRAGWYELSGSWNGQSLTWNSFKPFPDNEG